MEYEIVTEVPSRPDRPSDDSAGSEISRHRGERGRPGRNDDRPQRLRPAEQGQKALLIPEEETLA